MTFASPLVSPIFQGEAGRAFATRQAWDTQAAGRMAGMAFGGAEKLRNYRELSQAALDSIKRSKMPGAIPNWDGIGRAGSDLVQSLFQPRDRPESPSGDGSGAAFGARFGVDPVNFAYRQPTAWAGSSPRSPFYWDRASAMDTNRNASIAWNPSTSFL